MIVSDPETADAWFTLVINKEEISRGRGEEADRPYNREAVTPDHPLLMHTYNH